MVRGQAPRYDQLRHAADSACVGLARMRLPGQHLSRAFRHADGRGQSPSDDAAESVLPGDRDQSAERVREEDTRPPVPRKYRHVVRSHSQGRSTFTRVAGLKLGASFMRNRAKEWVLRACFLIEDSKRIAYEWSQESLCKGREAEEILPRHITCLKCLGERAEKRHLCKLRVVSPQDLFILAVNGTFCTFLQVSCCFLLFFVSVTNVWRATECRK